MPIRRVYLRTLGCPKNEVDGGVLSRHLARSGWLLVDSPETADVEVVNTCGFIEPTKIESLDAIWEAVQRKNSTASRPRKIIVTGCLAQRYGQQLVSEIDALDAVVSFDRPDLVLKAMDSTSPGVRACWIEKPGRTYRDDEMLTEWPTGQPVPLSAYVKISDGCDNACRFCAIPLIRGHLRSRPLTSIVAEIRGLVTAGTREIILVAQDTTSWGVDFGGDDELSILLRAIDRIDGQFWIRIMYAHPAFLTDRQIGAIADCEKIVPYLDMPLQHISNRMLEIMNRHVTHDKTQARIDLLRSSRPDLALRTTFIVGHPGETEDDFEELCSFAEDNAFERMGTFVYSREEETPSGQRTDIVPETIARERQARLNEAFDEWSADMSVDRVGQTLACLLERRLGRRWLGRTVFDAPEIDGQVTVECDVELPGIYNVMIEEAAGVDLSGRLVEDAMPVGRGNADLPGIRRSVR